MTAQAKARLRAMPQTELEQRYARAYLRKQVTMKWRYYFELTLRSLEAGIDQQPERKTE